MLNLRTMITVQWQVRNIRSSVFLDSKSMVHSGSTCSLKERRRNTIGKSFTAYLKPLRLCVRIYLLNYDILSSESVWVHESYTMICNRYLYASLPVTSEHCLILITYDKARRAMISMCIECRAYFQSIVRGILKRAHELRYVL